MLLFFLFYNWLKVLARVLINLVDKVTKET